MIDLSLYPVASGTSGRFDCPKCGGANSFSVTNDNGSIVFNCYRASCNTRGATHKGRTLEELSQLKQRVKPQEFKLPEYIQYGIVNSKMEKYLRDHYCLDAIDLYEVAYDPAQDRLLFLIKDNGKLVGAVGRDLSGRSRLKSLNYHENITCPFIVHKNDTIVLVEDCASACSVARRYTGCALLGTVFKVEYLKYILGYSRIIIALDKDATRKSLDMKKYLGFYKEEVEIWFLEKDLKDMEVIDEKQM